MFRVARGKWVSFLVMVLVVSLMIPAAWAAPGGVKGKPDKVKMKDIKGHWAELEIEKMGAKGLIKGFEDLSFRPGNEVTHQEVVAMLVRAMGLEDEAEVSASALLNLKHKEQLSPWAGKYLALAVESGLVLPGELVTIIPNKPAKRGEVAAYLARVLIWARLTTAESSGAVSFRDAEEISAELMAYVSPVYTWGLMLGDNQRKFQPNKPVTRAEMAVILARLDTLLENVGEDDEDEERVTGTLNRITLGDNPSIKIEQQDGAVVTFSVADDAPIYRNNRRADLEDLKVGDLVEAVVDGDEATFIAATAPNVIVAVEGLLKSVDLDARTIKLNLENGSEAVYQLAAGVQVKINGRTASSADLRQGDTVKLFVRDGQVIKVEARANQQEVKGIITAVTLGPPAKITIKRENNTTSVYTMGSNPEIVLDGTAAGLADILPGYQADITLLDGKVSRLIVANKEVEVRGTIKSVTIGSPQSLILKRSDGFESRFEVADEAQIKLDGESVTLAQLLGLGVRLRLREHRAISVEATTITEVTGSVKSVTLGTPSQVTVLKEGGQEETFTLAVEPEIEVDGEDAELSELKTGYRIRLRIRDGKVIEIDASTTYSVEGTVQSLILAVTNQLVVNVAGGSQETYTVAPDAVIKINGETKAFTDLRNGWNITLTISIEGNLVVRIEAETP
ncbi:hypothetical protein SY88_01660 [Clostridiales bacterium PH28_bin88]|nr:hypothetical protein SY88_01660 [Clostridiales bacterium PH28_bin88]